MAKKKNVVPKEIVNRKAKFEYQFIDKYEAGMMLVGTEVKAIKEGNVNLSDAWCMFDKQGNLIVKSMYIAEYSHGNINNHEQRRDRRLLLHKKELKKIERAMTEKGMTVVPYKVYMSERGFFKMEIFTAVGKKAFDKRHAIKDRENKKRLDRIMKEY